jgi:hypothetical protein
MQEMPAARTTFEITIDGRVDGRWSEWFEGMAVIYPSASTTLLRGTLADQAALFGVLMKVHNLGLHLISVVRREAVTGESGHE